MNHKASPYKLFQSLFVIILKPVLQSLLKAPLKLIATVLQLVTTDIDKNHKLSIHFLPLLV